MQQLLGGEVSSSEIARVIKLFRLRDRAEQSWKAFDDKLNEIIRHIQGSITPFIAQQPQAELNQMDASARAAIRRHAFAFRSVCRWSDELKNEVQALELLRQRWIEDENDYQQQLTAQDRINFDEEEVSDHTAAVMLLQLEAFHHLMAVAMSISLGVCTSPSRTPTCRRDHFERCATKSVGFSHRAARTGMRIRCRGW